MPPLKQTRETEPAQPSLGHTIRSWWMLMAEASLGEDLAIMAETGLTLPQVLTLFRLHDHSPQCVSSIAAVLHLSQPATSQLLDRLVRAEVVRPGEVNGLNEFTSEIHDARVVRLVNAEIDLAFNYNGRDPGKPPGIIIMLGGDFINGDIHEDLVLNSDRTTQQNVKELTDILASALDNMAVKFGQVFVPCVVGNHGRATLKKRTSPLVHTSHEWLLYTNLERHFKGSKRIKFAVAPGPDYHFRSYGHRYMLTHGDWLGTKGGDGIIGALGPIMRGTVKVRNAESQIGRDIDTVVMGHWHQPLWLPGGIVNGALKGYDEYAKLAMRAPYGPPSQMLWFVHPERGITARWEVLLDDAKAATETAPLTVWS